MLEIKNGTIRLKQDDRYIVNDFTFTLKNGEKAVIIGEEGNGKSTLLKWIYRQQLVEPYCSYAGTVSCKGRPAYLPQMLPSEDHALPLAAYFSDSEYYLHTDILAKLNLPLDLLLSEQTLGTLSGGERVKVQLAKLLMSQPDILLLDEPTNDLDIATLQWLETFIRDSRLPILYISHDETLIENTATTILHMEQLIRKTKCRVTVARCGYREYMTRRSDSFAHQDQVAQKQRDEYEKQMRRWQQIYEKVDYAQRTITRQDPGGGRLLKKKMHTILSQGKRFEREKENFTEFSLQEDAILTKFDENIRLPGGKTVLDVFYPQLCVGGRVLARNVRLYVTGNAHIGITGKNGIGKSTLLAQLWQVLKDRRDITAAYMPQQYDQVLRVDQTPIQYLTEHYTKDEVTKARTFLGSMKFTHREMTGSIGELSGGQQAKLLFLDMVLRGANVLLLDEPTRNFSPLSAPVVRAAIHRFGGAIISVSHDRKYLQEICDTVYELRADGLYTVENR